MEGIHAVSQYLHLFESLRVKLLAHASPSKAQSLGQEPEQGLPMGCFAGVLQGLVDQTTLQASPPTQQLLLWRECDRAFRAHLEVNAPIGEIDYGSNGF